MTVVYVALGLLTIWLLALTVAFVAVTRVAAIRGLATGHRRIEPFSLDDDGPEIGSAVPDIVNEFLARQRITRNRSILVLVSTTCGNCLERVSEIYEEGQERPLFLVSGRPATGQYEEMTRVLESFGASYTTGEMAQQVANALNIHSVPFAVAVENGHVADKAYLHKGSDLAVLSSAESQLPEHSDR